MNAFFKSAGTLLRKVWVWSLLLVFAGAMLVWFVGPLLAVDDHRFWQGSTARLLTISALFLLWGLAMVLVSSRRVDRLNRPENQANQQQLGLMEDERRQVRGRFKEALQTLKSSSRYGDHSERWRKELPWYLVLGEQGSGKTALLAASGLPFALDRSEAPTPGATSYCDWYFADEAVVVETAGRYVVQPDSAVDATGWSTLLGLLKSRRRAQPLNGVVVTLSVDTLVSSNEHDLDLHARHVHNRLQDIQQTLQVDIPVYLVLTQADRLAGFAEFFDGQGDSADAVLGACLITSRAGAEVSQVRETFQTLLQRLGAELIQCLHQERNVERRGQLLEFPRQAAHLGDPLCLFVESAFSAHRSQRINGLRGFYLTCAGGADRRTHFAHGVFHRVIFAEAGLAGLHAPEVQRIRRRQGLLALAAVLVLSGMGVLWSHSYWVNHQRLEQLAELIKSEGVAQAGSDQTQTMLALFDSRLEATRVFPSLAEARWLDRAGLYQGEVSRPLLEAAYEQVLHQQLLSHVATLLEEQVHASLDDRDRLLETLRAYLMLNVRERRDAAWLAEQMAGHWSARYPGQTSVQNRLAKHLGRLLARPFVVPLNDELVAQARLQLRGESLADVVYRALREQARGLEPLRLAEGRAFSTVESLIPGFYTRKYVQYFEAQGARLVTAIVQDNWVLGAGTDVSAMDLRRLMLELEQRYFSEYADAWSQAIGQVRMVESESLNQGVDQLASLTSAQSELVQLLRQVREHTRLLSTNDRLEALSQQASEVGVPALSPLLGQLPGLTPPDSARRALQRRFEPLHQLFDEQQNPGAELTQALRLLDELHLQLAALNRESAPEQAAFKLVKLRMEGQQPLLGNVRDTAARLPLPLRGWLEAIADDHWRLLLEGAYGYVNQRYQSEVHGFYVKAIQRRYPFNAHAGSDVALGDFQAFFKDRGVIARFYEGYLRPFVSVEGGRYRLRGLDGRSLPLSRSLLDQLSKAQVIRQGFFSEDQGEWAVRFTLAPYSLDQAVSRATLRIGEQQLEYRHGPIVPMTFQWPSEAGNARSSLVLERGTDRPVGIEKNSGAWSLFRLLELMQSEPASGRAGQILKADLAGLRANYLLTSQRSPSPFQMAAWRSFRLPDQL